MDRVETLDNASDNDKTSEYALVDSPFELGVVLWDSKIEIELVADCFDIKVGTLNNITDEDKTEGRILDDNGITITDDVALKVLSEGEINRELVADSFNIEKETLTVTSNDDETKGNTLDESGVTTTDAVALALLCDGEMTTELVADCCNVKDETLTNIADEDEIKGGTFDDSGVKPTDTVELADIIAELTADRVDINDEAFSNTSDDGKTKDRVLGEYSVSPTDAVRLAVLCDSEIVRTLVVDGVDSKDETSADDATEAGALVEFDDTPRDDVTLIELCDSNISTELVIDSVDIKDETLANTWYDDETEGRILVEFGVTPTDAVELVVLRNGEIVTNPVAGGVDIVAFSDTSDDNEREGKIMVELGVTPRETVALAILCDSEMFTDLVADGVDIEDETFSNTPDDDETEGKILVEFSVTPTDAVKLAVLCDGEMVTEGSADCFDIGDGTFADTSDDDDTEGKTLVEFTVTPTDAVKLAVLCDSEIFTDLVADRVDIKDETFADTSDDDETEREILVEFSVTPTDDVKLAVLFDGEMVTEDSADCIDVEDETFADTSGDDDTPTDAVKLAVLCDSEMVTEVFADWFDIEDETFANTSDDDEREGKMLVEFGVTARDMVALAILFDSDMVTEVAADCIDIEDETFADTLDDDDETEGNSLEESFFIPRDAVPLAVFCDSEKGKEFVAVCFDTADEAESIMLEKSCVTPKDDFALVVPDTVMFTKLVAGCFDMADDIFTVT